MNRLTWNQAGRILVLSLCAVVAWVAVVWYIVAESQDAEQASSRGRPAASPESPLPESTVPPGWFSSTEPDEAAGPTTTEAGRCDQGTDGAASERSVLFVTGAVPPEPGDVPVAERFERMGFAVSVVDDDAVDTTDAAEVDLIAISESVSSSAIGTMFTWSPVPVVVWERNLFDDLLMSTTNNWYTEPRDSLFVTNRSWSCGIVGEVTVTESDEHPMNRSRPPSSATIGAATDPGSSDKVWFGFRTGDALTDGSPAAAGRVALWFSYGMPMHTNEVGWELFRQAVEFAIGPRDGTAPSTVPSEAASSSTATSSEVRRPATAAAPSLAPSTTPITPPAATTPAPTVTPRPPLPPPPPTTTRPPTTRPPTTTTTPPPTTTRPPTTRPPTTTTTPPPTTTTPPPTTSTRPPTTTTASPTTTEPPTTTVASSQPSRPNVTLPPPAEADPPGRGGPPHDDDDRDDDDRDDDDRDDEEDDRDDDDRDDDDRDDDEDDRNDDDRDDEDDEDEDDDD